MNRPVTAFWTSPALAALALLLAGPLDARADALSPVVGVLRFPCPGGSDTVVSAPFHPAPRWVGRLSAAPTDAGSGLVRLDIEGNPGFAPGELTDTAHFLYCPGGTSAAGRHFVITAHTGNSVDIAAALGDLGGLLIGGRIAILPAWTLDTLFPVATQTALHPSSNALASQRGSEVLLFDSQTAGTSLAPARRFFLTPTGWLEAGSYAPAGEEIIIPGQPFVIRHPSGAAATTFTAVQQVYGEPVTIPIRVRAGGAQDSSIGLPRPVPTKLSELDLESIVTNSASTAPADRKDEVRIYDNALAGQNKGPLAVYFRVSGQWVKDAAGFPAAGDDLIDPAAGILIRKAAAVADGTVLWVNQPRYDVTAP